MRTAIERVWSGVRDSFSTSVLGTTSAQPPVGLGGGLSRPARLAATAGTLVVAFACASLSQSAEGAAFFLPALMVAGVFGGGVLAVVALLLSLILAETLFGRALPIWTFATEASLQTAAALVLRLLFRESRRWGVRYRRLLSAMSSAVTVSDGEGRIERPHPELSRLIGIDWPAYAGRRWLGAVHPEDHKLFVPANAEGGALHRTEVRLKDPQSGEWRWHLMRAVPMVSASGAVEEWISILTDIHERKLAAEQRDVMIGEARHRLKNLMTIIESIVKSSLPRDAGEAVLSYQNKFLTRLHALSAASDLALASEYTTMDAADVIAATLAPFREVHRLRVRGPKLSLSEATGGMLALAVNELATNAIKYGAWSTPEGTVDFGWTLTPAADGTAVTMIWKESGGPPPKSPAKEGYGSRVIRFMPSRERGGHVEFDYPPDGYVCRISFVLPRQAAPLVAD